AERNTNKPPNRKAQRAENVLHFAVLAFTQPDGNPDVSTLYAFKFGFNAAVEHAINRYAVLQLIQLRLGHLAMSAHTITAQPSGGRQLQNTRQPAIIGQKKKPFGIDIEPTDR